MLKIIDGIPTADARWPGPESPPMNKYIRRISAITPLSESLPTAEII